MPEALFFESDPDFDPFPGFESAAQIASHTCGKFCEYRDERSLEYCAFSLLPSTGASVTSWKPFIYLAEAQTDRVMQAQSSVSSPFLADPELSTITDKQLMNRM